MGESVLWVVRMGELNKVAVVVKGSVGKLGGREVG